MSKSSINKLDISEFDYSYEYDEVTCFEHPMVIALDYMEKDIGYYFTILSKFMGTYRIKADNEINIRDEILKRTKEYSGIDINDFGKLSFQNIIKSIDKGMPVIVGVNLKEIFYSSYYNEGDWNHWFLVIGYKKRDGLVTILDNTQFKTIGREYEEFNIPFDILKNANKSYIKRYGINYSFIEFEKLKSSGDNIMHIILKEYLRLNLMQEDAYRQMELMKIYTEMLKSGNYVESNGSLIGEIKKKIININKYRKIYFSAIKDYMKLTGYNEIYQDGTESFSKQCNELNKIWQNFIINSFVKLAKGEEERTIPGKIIESEVIIQNEVKNFLNYLTDKELTIANISNIESNIQHFAFFYENNEDGIAKSKMSDGTSGETIFEFNGKKNYNLWDMDEAPRLIFDVTEDVNEDIELSTYVNSMYRKDVNVECGLFIRDKDSKKIHMLGIENESKIVLSEIGITGFKYDLEENINVKLFIRVKKDMAEFGLYRGNENNEENEEIIFSSTNIFMEHFEFGITCKTWGKVDKAKIECRWNIK